LFFARQKATNAKPIDVAKIGHNDAGVNDVVGSTETPWLSAFSLATLASSAVVDCRASPRYLSLLPPDTLSFRVSQKTPCDY